MNGNECNSLDFQLGSTGIDATLATNRAWSIKVKYWIEGSTIDYERIIGIKIYLFNHQRMIIFTFSYANKIP